MNYRNLLAVAAMAASPIAAQTAPDAPLSTKSGIIGAPVAGKGQVVFFRPGTIMGVAMGCTVHEGGAEVARLGSGKYYAVAAEPGKHVFSTNGEAKDELRLEVEAGETYFVKCSIGAGIMGGRANLSPSDRASFAAKSKGYKMWDTKEQSGK